MGKSIMWSYIAQEPNVLERLLCDESVVAYAKTEAIGLEAVYLVAHGSSYNATVTVSDFFSRMTGLRVYTFIPAIFRYNASLLQKESREKTLVIVVSQTGTSSGAIDALDMAKKLGFKTLGITDISTSPVAKQADDALMLRCGSENSNAKTKGYSATITLLLLLALAFGVCRGAITWEQGEAVTAELRAQVSLLQPTGDRLVRWCEENDFGVSLSELYALGYGINYGTAMECQLKLMETMCIPTMFNDIGELSHGMHRAISNKSTVLMFKTSHPLAALTERSWKYLRGITGHLLMFDSTGEESEEEGRFLIPSFPLTESLLLMTLAVQVLSVYAPEHAGYDPNRDVHNDFTDFVHARV